MTTDQMAEGCKMAIKCCFALVTLGMSIFLGKAGFNNYKRLINNQSCQ